MVGKGRVSMDESLSASEYRASWAGAQSEIGKIRRAEGDAMPARESGGAGSNGPKWVCASAMPSVCCVVLWSGMVWGVYWLLRLWRKARSLGSPASFLNLLASVFGPGLGLLPRWGWHGASRGFEGLRARTNVGQAGTRRHKTARVRQDATRPGTARQVQQGDDARRCEARRCDDIQGGARRLDGGTDTRAGD